MLKHLIFPFPSKRQENPDSNFFDDLTEEEKQSLMKFEREIAKIDQDKIEYLRKLARGKGITADKLEDLKSECGELFVEEEKPASRDYRIAIARKKPESTDKTFEEPETAYLCLSMYAKYWQGKYDKDSCGWVKGKPAKEEYDEIGPLSGSAGVRYHCRICGEKIGESATIFS